MVKYGFLFYVYKIEEEYNRVEITCKPIVKEKFYTNHGIKKIGVLTTFTENTGEGVDSIQQISHNHPLRMAVLQSKFFIGDTTFDNPDTPTVIYFYNNGKAALLLSNNTGNKVYGYLFDVKTKKHIDNYLATITFPRLYHKNSETPIMIDIISLCTKEVIINYTYNQATHTVIYQKGWGSCMKESIEQLYNDWENDGGGTFSCWVTGPLCAIGGGIYCTFIK